MFVSVLCHPRCTFLASPLWMKELGQAAGLRGGLRLLSVPGTFTRARSAGGSSTALATWSGINSSTRVGVPAGRRAPASSTGVVGCPASPPLPCHAPSCALLLPFPTRALPAGHPLWVLRPGSSPPSPRQGSAQVEGRGGSLVTEFPAVGRPAPSRYCHHTITTGATSQA